LVKSIRLTKFNLYHSNEEPLHSIQIVTVVIVGLLDCEFSANHGTVI
jgi:hypothetical protein